MAGLVLAHIGTSLYAVTGGWLASQALQPLALRRVTGRLRLDRAVPGYGRVDAVFDEGRWKSFARMTDVCQHRLPVTASLIGAGQARVAAV